MSPRGATAFFYVRPKQGRTSRLGFIPNVNPLLLSETPVTFQQAKVLEVGMMIKARQTTIVFTPAALKTVSVCYRRVRPIHGRINLLQTVNLSDERFRFQVHVIRVRRHSFHVRT